MNNTTEEPMPTDSQVIKYMQSKLIECEAIKRGINAFTVEVNNYRPFPKVGFRAYEQDLGHGNAGKTSADAIDSLRVLAGKYSSKDAAAKMREEAAALIAQAEKLEAATL